MNLFARSASLPLLLASAILQAQQPAVAPMPTTAAQAPTHDSSYIEAKVTRRLNGLNGRRAGGTDIVHDDHARAFFAKAFDALARAVLLFGLTHQESVQRAAGYGNGHDDGIGTHGQSADGIGVPPLTAHFIKEDLADQLRAAGVERSGAAVDVIVTGAAGGQLEFTQAKRFFRQQF